MVRVLSLDFNERSLLKGFTGAVTDLAFAHLDSSLLGCVDEAGNLMVWQLTFTGNKILYPDMKQKHKKVLGVVVPHFLMGENESVRLLSLTRPPSEIRSWFTSSGEKTRPSTPIDASSGVRTFRTTMRRTRMTAARRWPSCMKTGYQSSTQKQKSKPTDPVDKCRPVCSF